MRRRLAGGLVPILLGMALIPVAMPVAAWEIDETATVTSIIDGDTFDCTPTGRIRLADIDAPEYYEDGYQQATDYLSGLISGQTVYLDIDDVYGTDPYDRWVAVVYVRHNATHLGNVNEAMLESGHAVIWDFDNEFNPYTWSLYVFSPIDAPPPAVTASANLTEGVAPLTLGFSSTASGGIPPYAFLWDFRDGATSHLQNPAHTFQTGGTFLVTIAVTDAARRTGTATISVTVHAPLSAAASADRVSGTAPLTATFTAGAAGGAPPYRYGWDFGDGHTDSAASPSHTYDSPGSYTVTVVVTDAADHTVTDTMQITVSEPTSTPVPPASGPAGPDLASPQVVVIVGVGASVAVAALFLMRRRRRH